MGPHSKVSDNSSGGQVVSTPSNDSSTQGGFRVGAGPSSASQAAVARPETDASPGAVRQTLRDFWGSKFDGKSSSATSQSSGVKSGKIVFHGYVTYFVNINKSWKVELFHGPII